MESGSVAQRRDGLVVSGADASAYLHSQVAQEVRDMEVGQSRWSLLLEPNGHVTGLARMWRRAESEYLLDTELGFGDVLRERLARFMIRVDAAVEEMPLVAHVALDVADTGGDVVGWWGNGSVRLEEGGGDPPDATAADDRLAVARVAAGWPIMGAEIESGERIPAELGIAAASVSFTKGCYPGQELVERMDSRGAHAPRRLCLVDAGDGAAPGDPLIVDGAEVGWMTSIAGGQALAFVKRGIELGMPIVSPPPAWTS